MFIDEKSDSPLNQTDDEFNQSQNSIESIDRTSMMGQDFGDPQRIRDDINGLDESTDRKQICILEKLNHRGSHNTILIEEIGGHLGRPVKSKEYFLNGQPEPVKYDDDQTISENVLALRNAIRHNRTALDNLVIQVNRDTKKLKELCLKKTSNSSVTNSNSLNANPTAEFDTMKKDVAIALAKVASLSKGNAFNTIDVEARVKVLEDECKQMVKKLSVVSKSLGALKNSHGQTTSEENRLPIGINRFDERLLKLEEHAFGQTSKNLFETTMETTMDLLSKEVQDLRKDLKLNLAGSEMNSWLDTKLKAFLDTPTFSSRMNSDVKTLLINYQITPRNLTQDTRMKIVEVSVILTYEIS